MLGDALQIYESNGLLAVEDAKRVLGVEREDLTLVGQKGHVDLLKRLHVLGRLRLGQHIEQLVVARLGEEQMRRSILDIIRVEIVYEVRERLFYRLDYVDRFELWQRFAVF